MNIYIFCAGTAWAKFILLCTLAGAVANATRSHDAIVRANDGFVAQPVAQLTVSGDYWFHTLVIKIPHKPLAHDYEKVSVGVRFPSRDLRR